MTKEEFEKMEHEVFDNEDFFDDLLHPMEVIAKLMNEIRRLNNWEHKDYL